ncbi:MAG: GNAT family N-acetyltransferase [Promethearchaeota archaeon]
MSFKSKDIRSYESGDEKEILELFERVFERKMSLNFWNWRFRDNPWAKGIITLAWDQSVLASHYAVMPVQVQVQNTLIKAVFSMTTMTHPEYRGKALFPRLARRTYETSNDLGYKLVYGFPNAISHGVFVKKLRWYDLGNVPIYSLDISCIPEFLKLTDPSITSEKITSFNDGVDELWNATRTNFPIAVPRTKMFLNWRFADHPEIEYPMFLLKNGKGELIGYYILKIFKSGREKKGHIIDYLLLDTVLFRDVLIYASDFFTNLGIQDVSFWMNQSLFQALEPEIQKVIKRHLMSEVFFGGLLFENFEGSELFKEFHNYYITMADSDVF